jgi:hypothetical protein
MIPHTEAEACNSYDCSATELERLMRARINLSNGWTDGIRTLIEGVLLKEFLTNVNYGDFSGFIGS